MDPGKTQMITSHDLQRLTAYCGSAKMPTHEAERLLRRIRELRVVGGGDVPDDLVTMNTLVRVVEPADSEWPRGVRMLTLSYPHAASRSAGCVSVSSSLGMRLLGSRVGDSIDGLVVDEVVYQPEDSRDSHL